jgi:hypothetical protein
MNPGTTATVINLGINYALAFLNTFPTFRKIVGSK